MVAKIRSEYGLELLGYYKCYYIFYYIYNIFIYIIISYSIYI